MVSDTNSDTVREYIKNVLIPYLLDNTTKFSQAEQQANWDVLVQYPQLVREICEEEYAHAQQCVIADIMQLQIDHAYARGLENVLRQTWIGTYSSYTLKDLEEYEAYARSS
jgi:hypothetical protein